MVNEEDRKGYKRGLSSPRKYILPGTYSFYVIVEPYNHRTIQLCGIQNGSIPN